LQNVYVIDTSSLIDLRVYYPQHIFPSVWKNLDRLVTENRMISSKTVLEEVSRQDDNLLEWCKSNNNVFKKTVSMSKGAPTK